MKFSWLSFPGLEQGMGRLDGVHKNITDMNLEELREHVRLIRADRRITKVRRVEKKATAKKSDKSKGNAKKALDKMSAEQLAALLAELEGDGDEPT